MKRCPQCGATKPFTEFHRSTRDGYVTYCKPCVKERNAKAYAADPQKFLDRNKKWRANNPEKRKAKSIRDANRHPEKRRARYQLSNAVASGKIIKPETCSRCGEALKLEAHHPDYSKPFDVQWVCRPCHQSIHNEEK